MKILTEDTLKQAVDNAVNQIDNITVAEEDEKGDIEQRLDRALTVAKREQHRGGKNWINVLVIGEGGTGKTARIKQWARDNGINLFEKDAKTMDETDLGGIPSVTSDGKRATKLSTDEMDKLNKPNSVLFLDEFNRARKNIRGTLLTLINDHVVNDAREDNSVRFLPNFLFTIAAINPPTPGYNTDELDAAELSRFKQMTVSQNPIQYRNYIIKELKKKLADAYDEEEAQELTRKINLADKLLSSREFKFDGPEEVMEAQSLSLPALNYRSLTNLLMDCDGTKKDFLDQWDTDVNPAKHEMAERILANYTDKDDKANSVFKGDDRPAFMRGPSIWDKIKNNI